MIMAIPSYTPQGEEGLVGRAKVPSGPVTTQELRAYFGDGPLAMFDLSSKYPGAYGRVRRNAEEDPSKPALVWTIKRVPIYAEEEAKATDTVSMLTQLPDVKFVDGEYTLGWRKDVFHTVGQRGKALLYAGKLFDLNYEDLNVLRVLNFHGTVDSRFIARALNMDVPEAREHAHLLADAGLVTTAYDQVKGGKRETFTRIPTSALK